MGGIVSTGHNNDDLINNLLDVEYIRTATIEKVFRAVDRAEYFLPENRSRAYKDVAWKCGNLHLSAPCIYSEVMEGLCLEPGLSFLNLGSGTGYLSTMIGLILGRNGVNHGVEIYEDVVQYANKKLDDFKKFSGAIDEYDFCEPTFLTGNCLCLSEIRRYDRVYCGASCPVEYEPYIKNLLKIGGILVVPINEHLMQFKRVSETAWNSKTLLPVSFASLVPPVAANQQMISPAELQPSSLQSSCRSVIRNLLRENVKLELPPPPSAAKNGVKKTFAKSKVMRRFVAPLLHEDSSDDDAAAAEGVFRLRSWDDSGNDYDNFFNRVIDTLRFTGDVVEEVEEEEDAGVAMEDTANTSMVANDGSVCSDMSFDESKRDGATDPSCSERRQSERKKFDSGIGDENEIHEVSDEGDDDEEEEEDDEEGMWDISDEDKLKTTKRASRQETASRSKLRRIAFERPTSSSSESEFEHDTLRMYRSRYSAPMREKIQALPLPQILKNYLNFYRDF